MQSIVIVGAGIAGSSTFFALARRGVQVTLVDDRAVGQATAASAGIIQPWSSEAIGPYFDLYAAGAAYYPELLSQLAEVGVTHTDYRRTGSLLVNRDAHALDEAQELLESRRAAHGEAMGQVERIDGTSARHLFPPLAEGLDAIHIEGGGRVDGRTLRDALIDAGRRLGGETRTGEASLAGGTDVIVGREPLPADAVVLTAGSWSGEILAGLGLDVPVHPQRGQITHLRLDNADTSAWPSVHPLAPHYLASFDDGRVVVGATRENDSGFVPHVTAQGQLQVLRDALSIAPGLADAALIETRVGLRPMSGDSIPVVGAVPGHSGLFVATGYGAGGLTMGPLFGSLVAQMILGETVGMLDVTAPRTRPPGAEGDMLTGDAVATDIGGHLRGVLRRPK
ncbi:MULTISPECIES: NAD(P)/FAD-dependent oxidoreductase [unclassified Pseudarthrobacter]|uniref:NAD(P)/FAD-dependent oxidoreductase n=1 Tax=unclassified Pseudarthrobacter TaxID=2647000 RepID=UPI0030786098